MAPRPRKTRYRNKRKKKWRQQKLAVGTVAKIARKVAGALDRKHMKQFRFAKYFAADSYTWNSVLQMPPQANWRYVQSGALESKIVSDLGGYVTDATAALITSPQVQDSLNIHVKGVQVRFAFQNRNTITARVRMMLIFIPNLNHQTNDAVDFLRPDVFMLYKTGTGNVLFDGFDKEQLKSLSTHPSTVRKYSILAQKTLVLPPTTNSGFPRDDGAPPTPPGYTEQGIHSRKCTLTHYYKGQGKRAYIKGDGTNAGIDLADGNFYYVLWSDLPELEQLHYVAASSVKFYVKEASAAVNTT